MKGARIVMLLAAWLCAGLAVDVAPADGWARTRKPHVPKVSVFHPFKTPRQRRARPYKSRSLTVRRADGTVLRGYRDNYGTHLRGPDGSFIHCQRSEGGVSDINIACR